MPIYIDDHDGSPARLREGHTMTFFGSPVSRLLSDYRSSADSEAIKTTLGIPRLRQALMLVRVFYLAFRGDPLGLPIDVFRISGWRRRFGFFSMNSLRRALKNKSNLTDAASHAQPKIPYTWTCRR